MFDLGSILSILIFSKKVRWSK